VIGCVWCSGVFRQSDDMHSMHDVWQKSPPMGALGQCGLQPTRSTVHVITFLDQFQPQNPRNASAMSIKLTPLKDLRVLKHQIPAHGLTPNTSIQHKPLLIYKSAFPANVTASDIESHLNSVGVVKPQWRYTMYTRSHFHVSLPNMHTCLGRKRSIVLTSATRQPPTKS
jgi:hypothetical protein